MPVFTQQHKIKSELVYEGEIIGLRVDQVGLGDKNVIREVVEHGGGVVILCQPHPDEVILVKQYRYAVNEELIEFPAGRIEPGEHPLFTAKRELTEESGYAAETWEELSRFFSAPGFCNELLYMYRATDVKITEKQLDEDEETEVMLVTIPHAWQLLKQGQIKDAKTVAGIGLLFSEYLENR